MWSVSHILQGNLACSHITLRCQWSNPEEYGCIRSSVFLQKISSVLTQYNGSLGSCYNTTQYNAHSDPDLVIKRKRPNRQRCTRLSVYRDSIQEDIPDSKVHGANMGPIWVLSAPDGPHVGLMNLAIRDIPVAMKEVAGKKDSDLPKYIKFRPHEPPSGCSSWVS